MFVDRGKKQQSQVVQHAAWCQASPDVFLGETDVCIVSEEREVSLDLGELPVCQSK